MSDESDLTTRTVGDRIDGRLALALDPAYPLHNAWSHAYACDIGTLRAENRALRADLDGWRKANAILSKGMESQAELTDGLKQEARSLRASLEVERKLHDSNSAELVRRAASLERDRDELAAENARLRDALQAVLCDGRATPAMREAIKKALESP